jgi:ribosomal protein L11 methyltransferase
VPYIEIKLTPTGTDTPSPDLYIPFLFEIGCEGLLETDEGLLGYIQSDRFDRRCFEDGLRNYYREDRQPAVSFRAIRDKNWNEEWEKAYEPVAIGNECLIRAPWHNPAGGFTHQVIISPRMSFGTGHHETTRLICEEILGMDLSGKKVIDLGCGTGILAIISSFRGARSVTAIDHDEQAVQNTLENIRLNRLDNIRAACMALDRIDETGYDLVMANINRNVLHGHMDKITGIAGKNALLLLSGIYRADVPGIIAEAGSNNWQQENVASLNNWAMIRLRLKPSESCSRSLSGYSGRGESMK